MGKFDSTGNSIDYFYYENLFDEHHDISGLTTLNFNDFTGYVKQPLASKLESLLTISHNSRLNLGVGGFVDSSGSHNYQNKFHFFRITDSILSKIVGKAKIDDCEIERKFVLEFDKRYGKYIIDNGYLMMCDIDGVKGDK